MHTLIAEYLKQFDESVQVQLNNLYQIIKEEIPEIPEDIGYKMPVFRMKGRSVYFAAFKNHLGFYPGSEPIKVFKSELQPYKTSKGAIQFQLGTELPKELIQSIVRYNYEAFQAKK